MGMNMMIAHKKLMRFGLATGVAMLGMAGHSLAQEATVGASPEVQVNVESVVQTRLSQLQTQVTAARTMLNDIRACHQNSGQPMLYVSTTAVGGYYKRPSGGGSANLRCLDIVQMVNDAGSNLSKVNMRYATPGLTLPLGAWEQSCRDARVEGSVLRATCTKMDGTNVASQLDLRANGQTCWSAENLDGVLTCVQTR